MTVMIRLYDKKKLTRQEALNKLESLYEVGRYSKEIFEEFKTEVK